MGAAGVEVAYGNDRARFDREALACLDSLHAFAMSLARDRGLAEDLVQEAYVRAYRARNRPGAGDNLRAWMFTILHNVWRNQRRRPTPVALDAHPRLQASLPSSTPPADEVLQAADRGACLTRAIESLPEHYREVVMLRYGQGFSYKEIATVLECPAGTVMSRLARAREALRVAMVGT